MFESFKDIAALVKRYFSVNGQHIVQVDGDNATGVAYTKLTVVREQDGKEIITDYNTKYEDTYVRQNGT